MTTLTRDEIHALTDDELRKAIAEERGWKVWFVGNGSDVALPPDMILPNSFVVVDGWKDARFMPDAPNWPADIADAWELVDEINDYCWTVNIQLDQYSVKAYLTERGAIAREPKMIVASADTAPRAIAEAWLMYRMERKGE